MDGCVVSLLGDHRERPKVDSPCLNAVTISNIPVGDDVIEHPERELGVRVGRKQVEVRVYQRPPSSLTDGGLVKCVWREGVGPCHYALNSMSMTAVVLPVWVVVM